MTFWGNFWIETLSKHEALAKTAFFLKLRKTMKSEENEVVPVKEDWGELRDWSSYQLAWLWNPGAKETR